MRCPAKICLVNVWPVFWVPLVRSISQLKHINSIFEFLTILQFWPYRNYVSLIPLSKAV